MTDTSRLCLLVEDQTGNRDWLSAVLRQGLRRTRYRHRRLPA
ncbi:MAG: hypothetical protein WDN06_14200 [Asticcacaulis sp.]